jgi:hypothetical protein
MVVECRRERWRVTAAMGPLGRAASGCWAGWCVGLVSGITYIYVYKYMYHIYIIFYNIGRCSSDSETRWLVWLAWVSAGLVKYRRSRRKEMLKERGGNSLQSPQRQATGDGSYQCLQQRGETQAFWVGWGWLRANTEGRDAIMAYHGSRS